MMFDSYAGPKAAETSEMQATMFACIANTMPSDWPLHTQVLQREEAAYAAARRLDPASSDPLSVARLPRND